MGRRHTRKIHLPDDEPELIYTYVQWTYARQLPINLKDCENPDFDKLAKLYVYGEKVLDDDFQDNVLNALISYVREPCGGIYVCDSAVKIIYDGVSTTSPARRMLVNMHIAYGDEDWAIALDGKEWDTHKDIKDDLINAFWVWKGTPEDQRPNYEEFKVGVPCKYHLHGEVRLCTAKEVPEVGGIAL